MLTASIELLEGIHEELDANALEAAEKWRFEPGQIQGKPAVGVVTISIAYVRGGKPRATMHTRRWQN